jgi:hypothetical protein
VFADDQDASHIRVNGTVDSGHPDVGHDERLFAVVAPQLLGFAEIGGIRRIGVVFTASRSDGDVLREVRDRQEIEDLTWRYARALDTNDAEAYASVYAPDGQFGTGANATKGRDALRTMLADSRQPGRAFLILVAAGVRG